MSEGRFRGETPFLNRIFTLGEELGVTVFDELRDAVHQLLDVGGARHALDRSVRLEISVQARIVGDLARQLQRIHGQRPGCQAADHVAERPYLHDGRIPQTMLQEVGCVRRPEERHPVSPGRGSERLHRGVPYPARRLVHRPLERLVVVGVHHQLEVSHHVLDLGPLEEGIAGIDHVGDVAPAQRLLERA